jgi:hypothetical protein
MEYSHSFKKKSIKMEEGTQKIFMERLAILAKNDKDALRILLSLKSQKDSMKEGIWEYYENEVKHVTNK